MVWGELVCKIINTLSRLLTVRTHKRAAEDYCSLNLTRILFSTVSGCHFRKGQSTLSYLSRHICRQITYQCCFKSSHIIRSLISIGCCTPRYVSSFSFGAGLIKNRSQRWSLVSLLFWWFDLLKFRYIRNIIFQYHWSPTSINSPRRSTHQYVNRSWLSRDTTTYLDYSISIISYVPAMKAVHYSNVTTKFNRSWVEQVRINIVCGDASYLLTQFIFARFSHAAASAQKSSDIT